MCDPINVKDHFRLRGILLAGVQAFNIALAIFPAFIRSSWMDLWVDDERF